MRSGSYLERNGSGEAKKSAQARIMQLIFEVIFEILEHLLQCIFGKFFGMAFFFEPETIFEPKVPKSEPKGSQNGSPSDSGDTLWEV